MYSRLPMYQRVGGSAFKKSLDNIKALDDWLGNPHRQYPTLHVAGTNGKGSSAHMLAAMLQAHGFKTGLYTSPHLKNFTERIRIDGKEMAEIAVMDFIDRLKPEIERISPSFFEITVAMAFDYFARQHVDAAVIEVGLGGRLDSTNILKPKNCLITNISFDHMDMLGDTLPQIAFEKAGIIKPKTPVTISQHQAEVAHVFANNAKMLEAPIIFADSVYRTEQTAQGLINVYHQDTCWLENIRIDLLGMHQRKNLVGAIHAFETFSSQVGFKPDKLKIKESLTNICSLTELKGRWQQLSEKPLAFCDVGHNEDGLLAIAKQLEKYSYKKLHIVFGMVKEKSATKLLSPLPQDAFYYFCCPNVPRGLASSELQEAAESIGLFGEAYDSVNQAIRAAYSEADGEDLIFIGGSNFVVAEIEDL